MINWNDYPHNNSAISLYLNTVSQSGIPTSVTSGAIGIFVDNNASYLTTGITFTANFASQTGIHLVSIPSGTITGTNVTCTAFYVSGVVDSVNVARRLVGVFSVGRFGQGPSNFTGLIIGSDGLVEANILKYNGVSASSGDFTSIMKSSLTTAATGSFDMTSGVQNVNVSKFGNISVPSGDFTSTMKSSINTEVLDVMNTDTYSEPGQGVPTSTPSYGQMLRYLYKNWRNKKTQTASEYTIYNAAGTVVDHKSSVSGTNVIVTINDVVSGP